MITEQYVSFDTAKMLKEAAFDVPCDKWYGEEGFFMSGNYKSCKCPTQQLAERWLREVHGIVVDVVFEPPKREKDWRYFIGNMDDMVWVGDFVPSDGRYETYEEAMEGALQEALRLIIKNKDNEQRY